MDYEIVKLKEIADFNRESIGKNSSYEFINYLDTANITNGTIDTIVKMPIEDAPSRAKRIVHKYDIIYSTVRPNLCHYGILDSPVENMIVSTGFAVISCKDSVNPYYIYNYLTQNDITMQLHTIAENSTSAYPSIKPSDLEEVEIRLPKLEIQNKIAKILTDIDRKIHLNNEINNNLYEEAVALYKDKFKGIEQGEKTIGEYMLPKRGKNLLTRDAVEGEIPVVAGGLEPSAYHNQSNTKSPVITISASGANAGYTNLWNIPVWASDCSYIDESITKNVYFWYIVLKTRQNEIFDAQTGSAQPHIYPQHIAEMPIDVLNDDEVEKYNTLVEPLFKMIGNNKTENIKLSQLRDALLPKLMNGEIDLDNIEI